MRENAHSKAIPEPVLQSLDSGLDAQLQALTPFATPLTPEERQSMLKVGPKTFLFVETAHTLAKANPGLTSKSFDMAAFDADFADLHGLTSVRNKARQLLELLDDIYLTAGSGSEYHSLDFYADVKAGAERDVPQARAVFEQLRAAYPARKRHKNRSSGGDAPEETP